MKRAYQIKGEFPKDKLYENPLTLISNEENISENYERINRRIFKTADGFTIMQIEYTHRDGIPSRWYEVQ